MIGTNHLRQVVVKGLKDYLQVPVIRSNQNAKPPSYPFISYTVTTPKSVNNGTYGEYEDGIDRKLVKQFWSISVLSNDDDESISLADRANEWFDHTGRSYLENNDVIVQSITSVQNRDNILTAEYEYKNGFDVVFYLFDEVENKTVAEDEYIEATNIERKEE